MGVRPGPCAGEQRKWWMHLRGGFETDLHCHRGWEGMEDEI